MEKTEQNSMNHSKVNNSNFRGGCTTGFIFIIVMLTVNVFAQYFGRNKVQYEDFNFKVLKTDNFNVYYYPQEAEPTRDVARMLERWNVRFGDVLDYQLSKYQPLILYANHGDFQQTNVVQGLISQGTGGVTEGLKSRIVLPLTGVNKNNDHVIGHELVHAFQYGILKSNQRKGFSSHQIPTWFIEGMAEYLSVGREAPLTAMWLRDAVLNEDVPSIRDVSRNPKYFPYRWGHAIWAYVGGKYGDEIISKLFKGIVSSDWEKGFERVIGMPPDSLSEEWKNAILNEYKPPLEERTRPQNIGEPILTKGGGINLAPVISPHGKYVAFLSRRDVFTIDLYLADARTGKVIKKLVSSNSDAHFDALRFMNSAGSWSPDGQTFAFVVFENGDNRIAFLDIASRKIMQPVKIEGVGAISDLAWSPDGQKIALSGTIGGTGNLFLYDLQKDSTAQLTDDPYSEIQPAWSPDGQTLAFATDRGSDTDLNRLAFGAMKIGLLDMTTREVSLISITGASKHINPQFSPDGKQLFFVADPDGFSDLYSYSFEDRHFSRLTRIATGISGLTELSPAMSVSQNTGRIVFSVFDNREYHVYALDPNDVKPLATDTGETARQESISLPTPPKSGQGLVDKLLQQPDKGLPQTTDYKSTDYHPTLKLISIGQPAIGVAVDRFGASLGGGVSFLFSDLLGNRMLGVAAQINGGIKDLGGQALYMNRNHRLNWGGVVGHIPYQTARVFAKDTLLEGNIPARKLTLYRQRVFIDRLSFLTEYPFSTNRRLEMSTGFTRISYDLESQEVVRAGGTVLNEEKKQLDAPSGLNLFQSSVAYVGDYSFFGFTSPANGRRYRFEIEPTIGSLGYFSVLADYRNYFFFRPFTFAVRAYHHGRYLKDAESNRLAPFFLGFETLVRGYNLGSFDLSECTGNLQSGQCPEMERLIGSRISVINAELRLPLFGTERFGLINFPYLPTELAAFFDAGVAWTRTEQPDIEFSTSSTKRIPVTSAGLAARFNLLGFLIAQVYYAFPFQRPDKTALFGFVIAPGW